MSYEFRVARAPRVRPSVIVIAAVWLMVSPGPARGGELDTAFQQITTMVVTQGPGAQGEQGTGFFYQQLAPPNPKKAGPQWRAIERVWLVTNRHIVLTRRGGVETLPDIFSFGMRRIDKGVLKWEMVTLPRKELLRRAKFDADPRVDVAVVEIYDLLKDKLLSGERYEPWYGVSDEDLPAPKQIPVEVSDDIIAIGYPRGFYDSKNLFPIVKSGIIATAWGNDFDGMPYFLVDAKLFPGSSGSLVLTKPSDLKVFNAQLWSSKEKQFAFLGVYSGAYYHNEPPVELDTMTISGREDLNLGIVWYGSLVDEIIKDGVAFQQSVPPNGH